MVLMVGGWAKKWRVTNARSGERKVVKWLPTPLEVRVTDAGKGVRKAVASGEAAFTSLWSFSNRIIACADSVTFRQ
jgi:hypothetical protein